MYILLSVNKTCFPSRAPCYNAINLLMTLLNLIANSDVMIVARGGWGGGGGVLLHDIYCKEIFNPLTFSWPNKRFVQIRWGKASNDEWKLKDRHYTTCLPTNNHLHHAWQLNPLGANTQSHVCWVEIICHGFLHSTHSLHQAKKQRIKLFISFPALSIKYQLIP